MSIDPHAICQWHNSHNPDECPFLWRRIQSNHATFAYTNGHAMVLAAHAPKVVADLAGQRDSRMTVDDVQRERSVLPPAKPKRVAMAGADFVRDGRARIYLIGSAEVGIHGVYWRLMREAGARQFASAPRHKLAHFYDAKGVYVGVVRGYRLESPHAR